MKKEEILVLLTAINGQYNLSKETLGKIADMAPADLTQDTVNAWVESMKPYMGIMQSYADSRVGALNTEVTNLKKELEDAKKTVVPTGTSDWEKALGDMRKEFEGKLTTLTQTNEEQKKELDKLRGNEKSKTFSELKKRVAESLGLTDAQLAMVEANLTEDMDEAAVNEKLSGYKTQFQQMGLHTVPTGSTVAGNTEAIKAKAKARVDAILAKQAQN